MKDVRVYIKSWFSKAFNLPILQKSRMPWVDYLRGIAIILVVYRHTLVGLQRSGLPITENAINLFFSFRIPLFFIVSGIFINQGLASKGFKKLVTIRFETLIYPYFIWSILQITLQILMSGYVNSDRGWVDYTFILYRPKALDQFWYLPALFNTTVIYLFIKTKLKPLPLMQIALGLGLYFIGPYLGKISMLSDWMEFYLFFAIGDIISKAFFKESIQKTLKNPWALLLLIPFFVGTQLFYLSQPEEHYHDMVIRQAELLGITFIGCLTMFFLAFRLQIWNILSFLRVLGFHSLYIYVMHVLVIAFVRMLLTKIFHIHNLAILLPCGILLGVTIPVIVFNLLIKDNIGWFLFFPRKPKADPSKVKPAQLAVLKDQPDIK